VSNPVYAIISWTTPNNAFKAIPLPEPYNPADDINNLKAKTTNNISELSISDAKS